MVEIIIIKEMKLYIKLKYVLDENLLERSKIIE